VNQRAVGENFAGFLVDGAQHEFHGAFDTHTEACGAGQDDFQGLILLFENRQWAMGYGPGEINEVCLFPYFAIMYNYDDI
jgi:hypothetical protein